MSNIDTRIIKDVASHIFFLTHHYLYIRAPKYKDNRTNSNSYNYTYVTLIPNYKRTQLLEHSSSGSDNPHKNDNAHYYIEVPAEAGNVIYVKAICANRFNDRRATVHGRITFPEGKIESRLGYIDDSTVGDNIEADDFIGIDNF